MMSSLSLGWTRSCLMVLCSFKMHIYTMSLAYVLTCFTQSLHVGHHYVWSHVVGIGMSASGLLLSSAVNPCPIQCPSRIPAVTEGLVEMFFFFLKQMVIRQSVLITICLRKKKNISTRPSVTAGILLGH